MPLPIFFSGRRAFSYPFYLFAVMTVLIGILVLNGYFEIQRTRSQLFNILETEGLLVIKGLEKNSGNVLAALSPDHGLISGQDGTESPLITLGIEDLLIERLISLALQLDQEIGGKPVEDRSLAARVHALGVTGFYFLKPGPRNSSWEALPVPLKTGTPFFQKVLDGKTRLAVFRGQGALRQNIALAVAVARRFEPGIVILLLSNKTYYALSRQIVILGFLEDFSGRGNIAYLRLEDPGGKIIAQTGETTTEDLANPRWREKVRSGDPGLYWVKGKEGEFLEIVRPFSPAGKNLGFLRLGLSLKEVVPLLDQGRRYIVFMSLILLGLGAISLFFIFRLQGRHIQKLNELEEQIRLKEELSAMNQLAAGVAHEIKNPLNAIGLVVQRLENEFVPHDPEEQKEYKKFTRIVRSEIGRVNQIIGQFLMMARPLNTDLTDQSLTDILEYVLEVLGEEIRKYPIGINKVWEENLPMIRCDRFQLTQAFLNILNNALEAMPKGGALNLAVKRVRGAESGVWSGMRTTLLKTRPSEPTGDFLEINIRDTGRGIPPEGLKKIFAPYYTTKEKGVGLGLAITQKMIQAQKGTLEVQSQENRGTTVIIRLPVVPSDQDQKEPPSSA